MTSFAHQPRISVCMAAYNGEQFIVPQLLSVLRQLGAGDEVVIVDDASSDNTCGIIESLADPRIRLFRRQTNQGVLHTFEETIQRAHGEILFLADQDDLWAEDKVATVLTVFAQHLETDIVASDAALIDRDGIPIGPSYYTTGGPFRPGILSNLIHCSYLGCTMAFRSRIRDRILPFPRGKDVFHDLWIGTSNALFGGTTLFIDRSLVHYRRHAGNLTGNRKLRLSRQLRIRWDLCNSLAIAWWKSRRLST